MESTLISTTSSSSLPHIHHPLFSSPPYYHITNSTTTRKLPSARGKMMIIKASSSRRSSEEANGKDYYGGGREGRLVDENMIVLRKRIHEMKMIERNYEPPSHWMNWEKRYYTSYDSIICDFLALLQTFLMNTRPSVALATLALLFLCVPTSTAVASSHLLHIAKDVFTAALHGLQLHC